MKVFITGTSNGQLHWELLRSQPESVNLVTLEERLDLTDADRVRSELCELAPDVIINAAAYTAVDKAETDIAGARAVNEEAVQTLAEIANQLNAHLIHVSTDFVFGKGDGSPFTENASVDPVSVYGQTKLAGENILRSKLPDSSLVVRTAWVYSSHGANFVKTMLRLMRERGEVGVIADQIGSPTWARSLAEALWVAAEKRSTGTMHWTGAGAGSWYDFAVAIAEEAKTIGLLDDTVTVNPLTTEQYPTPAARPYKAAHWREDLRNMLKELS